MIMATGPMVITMQAMHKWWTGFVPAQLSATIYHKLGALSQMTKISNSSDLNESMFKS